MLRRGLSGLTPLRKQVAAPPPLLHLPVDPNQAANRLFLDGKNTFFRRALPPPSIELSSPEGTRLFTESLLEGNAVGFFRLVEQLHTQNEPEYCGLASLVTVLNAMDIDPKRIWKGNWRFYSEELLNCCVPLTNVKRDGIDFDKLANLAICNGMHVEAKRGHEMDLSEFTTAVESAAKTLESCIILAYSRKQLGQTGDGHYSPMGAYHKKTNMVLILDCARFKYRPHWTPVPVLFDAMRALDEETKLPRGYLRLSPTHVPPNSAIVLKVLLRLPGLPLLPVSALLGNELVGESNTARDILRELADRLEGVFRVEFSKHGAMSLRAMEVRKSSVERQIAQMKSWEVEVLPDSRRLQRIALVLSFLGVPEVWNQLPANLGHSRRQEICEWIKPKGEELEVEISFAKLQVAKLLQVSV